MTARISYSLPTSPSITKTIDLPRPRLFVNDPFIRREIHTTVTGDMETILFPRMDVSIHAEFAPSTSASLRRQITNWWQHAQQGNSFRFVFDTSKTVKTTLSGQEAEGQTVLSVANTTGITAGQEYVIISDQNYELVTIDSINGGAGTVTITESLGKTFASGSVFRDQFLWDAVIRDPDLHSPITDHFDPEMWGTWSFAMNFFEDIS